MVGLGAGEIVVVVAAALPDEPVLCAPVGIRVARSQSGELVEVVVEIDELDANAAQEWQGRIPRHFAEDDTAIGLLQALYRGYVVNVLGTYFAVGCVGQALQGGIVVENPHDRSLYRLLLPGTGSVEASSG